MIDLVAFWLLRAYTLTQGTEHESDMWKYVEIKCQLDATDEFLLQVLLLAQHVSGTIMPIIRSSRGLYKWLLPVVFGAWFSSCRYGVELRVVYPVWMDFNVRVYSECHSL